MSRASEVQALAPAAPPCFQTRTQWVEYAASAAEHQRPGHAPGPLLFEPGKPVRFNPRFDFCRDCTERHEGAMKAQGRCRPTYLLNLFESAKEPA